MADASRAPTTIPPPKISCDPGKLAARGGGNAPMPRTEQTEFWEGVDRVRCNADDKLQRMISAT